MDALDHLAPSDGSQPAYAGHPHAAHPHPHPHRHSETVGIYNAHAQPVPPHLQGRPHPPHHSQSLPNIQLAQAARPFSYPAYLSSPGGPRPPPHAHNLPPAHPHSHPHLHPSHLSQHPALHQAATCVPHLIRDGMDPTQVDMRSFYPYVPNEVKHRKRTTRDQLKVLESMFKEETKPSATQRKALSTQLGMTPREVQVWFQNRRAKVKNEAKKVAALRGAATSNDTSNKAASSPRSSPSPSPEAHSEPVGDTQGGRPHTGTSGYSEMSESSSASGSTETPGTTTPEYDTDKDIAAPVPSLPTVNVAFTSPFGASSEDLGPTTAAEGSYYNNQGEYSPYQHAPSQSLAPPAHDILALRRGSLPNLPFNQAASSAAAVDPLGQSFRTNAYGAGNTYNSAPAAPYDVLARRASIATTDAHAMRLSAHPYAHLAAAANSRAQMAVHRASSTHSPASRLHSVAHSPSHSALRRASYAAGADAYPLVAVPGPMMREYGAAAAMGGLGAYAGSTRAVPAPPPGPLPEQGFSFGAPPPGLESRGSVSSEPEEEHEHEREGDFRYAEWERMRGGERFGSVASVASYVSAASGVSEFGGAGGSESSWTSWYPSEEGGGPKEGADPDGRRGSGASGQLFERFSELDVGTGPATAQHPSQTQAQTHPYSNPQPHASPGLSNGGEDLGGHGTSTAIRRSSSSELAYALQAPESQEQGGNDTTEAATGVNSSGAVPMVGQRGQYEPATGPYVYQPSQDLGKGYSREYPVFPDDYALDPYASYAQVQTQVPAQTSALSPIYEGGAMELSTVSGMQVCVPAAGGLEHAGFPAYGEGYQ